VLALPKGRIVAEVLPLLARAGIVPEAAFGTNATRRLWFDTADPGLKLIRVRSFDVATFVAFGAAHLGIVGSDVLAEFAYSELYAPLDLRVGRCRMVVAELAEMRETDDPAGWSHIRIATKYPNLTRAYFAARGVQAECIKLNGSIELAPRLGLCRRIVDLVDTGATLKANDLVEVEQIAAVTSRLIVNRAAMKTRSAETHRWIDRLAEAVDAAR